MPVGYRRHKSNISFNYHYMYLKLLGSKNPCGSRGAIKAEQDSQDFSLTSAFQELVFLFAESCDLDLVVLWHHSFYACALALNSKVCNAEIFVIITEL